jgi:very-short-patch-repair endonuclease
MKSASTPEDSLSRPRERAGVRAKALRQSSTDAENLLWYRLRNRQLLDLKFRRQRPIGKYIADFTCLEIRLVVELDGGQHVNQEAYDRTREEEMKRLGFSTLRFWDNDVLKETDAVMEKIRQLAETLTPALSRTREREQDTTLSGRREGEQDKGNERS